MLRHSLRSIILCSLALVASAFLFALPASASISLHHGDGVLIVTASPHDIAQDIANLSAAIDKMAIHRESAAFLNSEHDINPGGTGGDRMPFGLSPEYAESYATDGLNFIDLRRRC
jgi:hypothetical protein